MVGTLGIVLALWLFAPAGAGSPAEGQSLIAVGVQSQARAVGYVRSRSGVGLPGCQLDFYGAQGNLAYRVYTDQGGAFFIDNPRRGDYSVRIVQGGKSHQLRITSDGRTISPSTLVVPW